MKIGIIIFSQTGNTLYVAEKLKERFNQEGFDAEIKQIEQADSNNRDLKKIEIKNMPQFDMYDVLIFGSPVQAFSLAAVFKNYLQKINSIQGKISLCYITKGIASKGFGGNKAIKTITDSISSKGGIVKATGIICWSKEDIRHMQIANMTEDFLKVIQATK